ncbi:hypothetical protein G4B11_004072 [Aspergillus flavus]|nr:hypothetical protein G4B11_004072 [Aspergillus flavus]
MDTREIAEEIASHLDGLDIPNLLWGQIAHLYHLGLRSSPRDGPRIVEIAVSEHRIDSAFRHICAKYSVAQCDNAECCPEPQPDYHCHIEDGSKSGETTISLHRMPTVLTDLDTEIPNNPNPGDSNYVLVTDERLPNCSSDGSSGNHQGTLCVNRKRTARILTLARHSESLILRLCLNLNRNNAPAFFTAIEQIVAYYGENAQYTGIWEQLLCDLDNKNDSYGKYLKKQKDDWKHEDLDPESWQDCAIRNCKRSTERMKYTQHLRDELVNDGKLPSDRNIDSFDEVTPNTGHQ